MTSLGVALAVDTRGPTALYIVTDSRISWSTGQHWDAGQKTFASSVSPDIFGFCGDAFFPPSIIHQIIDQANCGILFPKEANSETRHQLFFRILRQSIDRQHNTPVTSFSVFHGARDSELMKSRFRLWEIRASFDSRKVVTWTDEERDLNSDHSYFAHLDGSGRNYVRKRGSEWVGSDMEGTSRAAIWSFCNTLHEGVDVFSGGPPQLVGIWRKGLAKHFGFWWKGRPYLSGAEVPTGGPVTSVDWFNHRFERCDGITGRRKSDAARHVKPV